MYSATLRKVDVESADALPMFALGTPQVDEAFGKPCHREPQVAIVGQDCIKEAADEIAKRNSSLISSVSHEAQLYGASVIQLALSVYNGQTVAPYNYVAHRMVKRDR